GLAVGARLDFEKLVWRLNGMQWVFHGFTLLHERLCPAPLRSSRRKSSLHLGQKKTPAGTSAPHFAFGQGTPFLRFLCTLSKASSSLFCIASTPWRTVSISRSRAADCWERGLFPISSTWRRRLSSISSSSSSKFCAHFGSTG